MEAVGWGAKTPGEEIRLCTLYLPAGGTAGSQIWSTFSDDKNPKEKDEAHRLTFYEGSLHVHNFMSVFYSSKYSEVYNCYFFFCFSKLWKNRTRSCKQQILKVTNVTRGKADRCRERDRKDRNNEDEIDKGKKMKNIWRENKVAVCTISIVQTKVELQRGSVWTSSFFSRRTD